MSLIQCQDDGPVRIITINRADKLNALDDPTRRELLAALGDGDRDCDVGAIMLTGAGRAFCTGQDVSAGCELKDAGRTVRETYNPLARALRTMGTPTVAAINGPAVGAGLGLALSCDLRYMADSAYLACSFGRVALVPDTGTTSALVRTLGHAWAFELAVTGRRMSAEEAMQTRLVNAVVPDQELHGTALQRARTLAEGPATAFALTKQLMVHAANDDELATVEREAAYQGLAADHGDHRAAIEAFLARARV